MTNSKILNLVNEIIAYQDNTDFVVSRAKLEELKTHLIQDINSNVAKKNGNYNVLKAFRYIEKDAPTTTYKYLNTIYKDESGYIIGSIHQVLLYTGDIKAEVKNTPCDFLKVYLNIIKEARENISKWNKIDIPQVSELKNIISETKAYNKAKKNTKKTGVEPPVYKMGELTNADINAEFLLNAINAGVTEFYNSGNYFFGMNDDRSLQWYCCGMRRPKNN